MPNENEYKYISKTKNGEKYTVNKKIGEETLYFGTYDSLRDAKFARDYFEENNWDTTKKETVINTLPSNVREKLGKHIYKDDTKYNIQKKVGDKQIYFGRYDTLEDAIAAREYFEANGWNPEDIPKWNMARQYTHEHRFIVKSSAGYQLKKSINGINVYFGSYNTLEEAITAREYFEKYGWNTSERFKFTKPRKQPAEVDLNKPYFQSMRLV